MFIDFKNRVNLKKKKKSWFQLATAFLIPEA